MRCLAGRSQHIQQSKTDQDTDRETLCSQYKCIGLEVTNDDVTVREIATSASKFEENEGVDHTEQLSKRFFHVVETNSIYSYTP